MRKGVIVLSLISVLLLIGLSLAAPSSAPLWLAATSTQYIIIRVILALALAGLIVTNPPRKILFRLALGAVAVFLIGWSLVSVYGGEVKPLDFLIFIQVGISFAIEALERTPEELIASTDKLLQESRRSRQAEPVVIISK